MPLKNSERTERIVAAASKLFASQGYHGTSTREIARSAGVSENTLFRHFDNKKELFWSTLKSQSVELKPRWDRITGIRSNDSPAVVLPEILSFLADFIHDKPDTFRLFAVAFLEMQKDAETVCFAMLAPLFVEMSRYLETNMRRGEVLDIDVSLLVASFAAQVLIYPQLSKLCSHGTAIEQIRKDRKDDAVAVCSKFWLDLLRPRLPVPASVPLCMGGKS